MAAHQAPPSLGFSRQEHWSGLPFPSPMHESEKWKWSCSVVSNFWLNTCKWSSNSLTWWLFFLVQIIVYWFLACCILASEDSQIIQKAEGTSSFCKKDQDASTHQLLGRKQNKNLILLYSLGRWGILRKSLAHLRKDYQDGKEYMKILKIISSMFHFKNHLLNINKSLR